MTKEKPNPINKLKIYSKKLGILLYSSSLQKELKEAFIDLIPSMSLEQIEKLINILESQYLSHQTKHIDSKFQSQVEQIVQNYRIDTHTKNQDCLKDVTALSQSLT